MWYGIWTISTDSNLGIQDTELLLDLATLNFAVYEEFRILECFNFVQYNPVNISILIHDLHFEKIGAYISKV
jgi:hypothetical protein